MKKIPTLYERDSKTHLISPKLAVPFPDTMRATEKIDGTSCYYHHYRLYKRHEIRASSAALKRGAPFSAADFRLDLAEAYREWIPAQTIPDTATGRWPGWLPVTEYLPEDKWHTEALMYESLGLVNESTYELVGPKVQANPYKLAHHELWLHGAITLDDVPTGEDSFEALRDYFCAHHLEGIVWWLGSAPYCKLKARDYGIRWP